jgi:transposase
MEIRAHDWTPGPSIEWRTAMEEYIGLDVSMKETAVSIRRAGERIWRGKCATDPSIIAELIRKRAPP